MARRLGNNNRQTERLVQRSQQGKAASRMAPEIRKAIKAQGQAASDAFLAGDEGAVAGAIESGRLLNVMRPAEELAATLEGKRILNEAKSIPGRLVYKATEEEQQALVDEVRAFIAANIGQKINRINTSTVAQVSRQIRIGREKGETPEEIAKRIRKTVKGSSAYRAQMIARTEAHQAAQYGMMAGARKSETPMQKEWIAAMDERTRGTSSGDQYDHIAADGEKVGLNDSFMRTGERLDRPGDTSGSAGNVIHCFPAGTEVRGRFTAGTRSLYSGPIVQLETGRGRKLTVTPNHPIQTSAGLVDAGQIAKGDYLVTDLSDVNVPVGVSRDNDQNRPAYIDHVFNALAVSGSLRSARVRREDFHGDGISHQSNVDIVSIDGVLRFGVNAALIELLNNVQFVKAANTSATGGQFSGMMRRYWNAATRIMRRLRVSAALVWRSLACLNPIGVRAGTDGEAGFNQVSANNITGNAERFGDSVLRLPSDVSLDEVISVNILDFSGHVYSLEECSGLMVANGIVTSNCRCGIGFITSD